MQRALLDTDILSEVLHRRDENIVGISRQYLRVFRRLTVSSLTLFEVKKGLTSKPSLQVAASFDQLLEQLDVVSLDQDSALLGGEIHGLLRKQGQPIGDIDPLLAATAIVHDIALATGNTDHYRRIVDLGFPLTIWNWRD